MNVAVIKLFILRHLTEQIVLNTVLHRGSLAIYKGFLKIYNTCLTR